MIKDRELKFFERLIAYFFSIICIIGGAIGLFLSINNYKSILAPIISLGFIFIGILYAIAAVKGKPISISRSKGKQEEN